MGEGECAVEEQPKKSRHRKKYLYSTILQQMEFYFSDSNLAKDRFLSQLISESPYIDISVFLQFNKIKKLNCTIEDIQKALKKSELISLSEDGTKLCRNKPIKINENSESCTIYVENIKADASHETLSQIFSDFGKVVYVSIPKYKHNKENKGFAFIEYESEEQATEAITFFESIGCKISSEKNPEDLQSILTFEHVETAENQVKSSKKRKVSLEDSNDAKKIKIDNEQKLELQADNIEDDGKRKKKNKKEKRKLYIKELGMQILSKKEWKKLRNRYLDLQKKKMKEFKQYLRKQHSGKKKEYSKDGKDSERSEENDDAGISKLTYTPGVIVKLKLLEPCTDVKKLKSEVRLLSPDIKYVDIPYSPENDEVYLRFGCCNSAKDFCTKDFMGQKVILAAEEEELYWAKINNDRSSKFQKLSKKQRGRDKILKKADKESVKHLRFDEND
ncbi:hypothetical protein GWI33_016005 [Rhynchophorus ferrugineus]|uniref:La-related protein 7 n=1 Tax=Rhynchophorus ferrugineus TaxID=354439 RepID=A0A834I148_RHYFE|nr:hypothetical protein GWI33_016005 [Rhynchophorus ferrugineus]